MIYVCFFFLLSCFYFIIIVLGLFVSFTPTLDFVFSVVHI